MINHFEETRVSFGIVKEHKSALINFQGKIDIPEIKKLTFSCGCMKLNKYDKTTKVLTIKYNAGNVPNHLPFRQSIEKDITVWYENGTSQTLTVTGIKSR